MCFLFKHAHNEPVIYADRILKGFCLYMNICLTLFYNKICIAANSMGKAGLMRTAPTCWKNRARAVCASRRPETQPRNININIGLSSFQKSPGVNMCFKQSCRDAYTQTSITHVFSAELEMYISEQFHIFKLENRIIVLTRPLISLEQNSLYKGRYGLERWLEMIYYWKQERCITCRPNTAFNMLQSARIYLQREHTSCSTGLGKAMVWMFIAALATLLSPGSYTLICLSRTHEYKKLDNDLCASWNSKSNYIFELVTCLFTSWLQQQCNTSEVVGGAFLCVVELSVRIVSWYLWTWV